MAGGLWAELRTRRGTRNRSELVSAHRFSVLGSPSFWINGRGAGGRAGDPGPGVSSALRSIGDHEIFRVGSGAVE